VRGRGAIKDAAGPPNKLAQTLGEAGNSPPPVALSVVICTKDRPQMLRACLQSLQHQTRRPEEIVVVDASATPARDVVDRLAKTMRGCHVTLKSSAPGPPRQRNLGARATTGSVVVYL